MKAKALLATAAVAVAGLAWWLWPGAPEAATAAQPAALGAQALFPTGMPAPVAAASESIPGAPLSPAGLAQREQERQQVQLRLEQAKAALAAYELHARYPHASRPASEHADQLRPFDPITEEHPLRTPGGTAMQGVKLVTSQDRVFLSGPEATRISVSLQDRDGRPLPLRFTRTVLKEVTEPGRTAQTVERPLPLLDDGAGPDSAASDGVFSTLIAPSLQGFGSFAGRLRLEVWMQYGGQPGFVYFDVMYTPGEAARWLPGVRETLVDGSLQLQLRAEVLRPGRYVVSARIDDAKGEPVAVALFNQELGAGTQTIPLLVFGRLLHDLKPAMPLRLRDVEAFLLLPDTFPDRLMLPRLTGLVHQSKAYPLSAFSPESWRSEERERYLAELGKDLNEAQEQLKRLGGGGP
jgi:hypothetical protein